MKMTISRKPTKFLLAEVKKKLHEIDRGKKVSSMHVINFENPRDLRVPNFSRAQNNILLT